MHGRVHHFITLALAVAAFALPPTASAADYDLTVGDGPTAGVTAATVDGLTTFRASGPQPATLAASDVNAELAAGRDVTIVDPGDYWLGGRLRVTAPLTGAGRALALEAPEGDVELDAPVTAGALTLAAAFIVDGTGAHADRTDVTGEWINLTGDNRFGRLTVDADDGAKVRDGGALTLGASRSGGGVEVLAAGGLAIAGDVTAHGAVSLFADAGLVLQTLTDGDFTAAPGTRIDAGGQPIEIHSAHRRVDQLTGLTLNGVPYAPGPALIPSATEHWGQSVFVDAAVGPYRFDFQEGDRTAPTAGVTFDPWRPQVGDVVRVVPACTDAGGSGLASCAITGQRADGTLDTTTAGSRWLKVTATDRAGNTATRDFPFFVMSAPTKPAPKPTCAKPAPTSVTLRYTRPKHTREVVATFHGKHQKVVLTKTKIVVTVDLRGRVPGTQPVLVTIRRTHGRKPLYRNPEVNVLKCGK